LCKNCILKQVIEGKIEGRIGVTGRRGRRRKQLLDDVMETTEYRKLNEGALAGAAWRAGLGGGCGSVFRQTIE